MWFYYTLTALTSIVGFGTIYLVLKDGLQDISKNKSLDK